jgi:hypothetical protein
MHGLALMYASFFFAAEPLELPKDVWEIESREIAMPIRVAPGKEEKINRLRLYISDDSGKTWKHVADAKPTDDRFTYKATKDGLYWFALQVEFLDGKCGPAELNQLVPAQKVYVNTERKALKPQKSYEDLVSEVEDLRKTVDRLKKRIAELEGKK